MDPKPSYLIQTEAGTFEFRTMYFYTCALTFRTKNGRLGRELSLVPKPAMSVVSVAFLARTRMHSFATLQLSTHSQGSIPSFCFAKCNPLYQAGAVKNMKNLQM